MIKIIINNKEYEWEYHGIKIIECKNSGWIFKQFLNIDEENTIFLNSKPLNKKEIIFINEYTKIIDILNFKKNGFLLEAILDDSKYNSLFNENIIEHIRDYVNNMYGQEIIKENIDFKKELANIYEVNDIYMNKNVFIRMCEILNNLNITKTLIISNVDFINFSEIKKFNNINFIIFTNNITNEISEISDLELTSCVQTEKNDFFEIKDLNVLYDYIEIKKDFKFNKNINTIKKIVKKF